MSNLIEPNLHPILVHFSYALSMTAVVAYLGARFAPNERWRNTLAPAADWILAFGAIAILATVAAGFQAYYSVAHDGPSHEAMTTHRNWAVPSSILILVLASWRWWRRGSSPSILFTIAVLTAAVPLTTTAWWGGKLVYGYGLGVSSLPSVSGDGHDHDHAHGDDDHSTLPAAEEMHDPADGHHESDIQAEMAPIVAGSPESVVAAFSAALKRGDADAVESLMSPQAIIAESGGAERSFEEYAGHHMPSDMAFTSAVDFSLKKRDVIAGSEIAVVISESQIHGTFRGEPIHSGMIETMTLRRSEDSWLIEHIHWSSAPIEGDHEH